MQLLIADHGVVDVVFQFNLALQWAAHALAQFGLKKGLQFFWEDIAPAWLEQLFIWRCGGYSFSLTGFSFFWGFIWQGFDETILSVSSIDSVVSVDATKLGSVAADAAPSPVLDITGNKLQTGVDYHILPVIRGRGGGLIWPALATRPAAHLMFSRTK
ncbi:voltage dependent anion channel 1 [Prunus dulcis]|uniref:Voltage dependent anion channel 1 n=1 Tax=Prunus dulcis TaxID=3755 RepID=A0A4Y1RGX2_PRUDU|nr:voltage dependent anion channel 1 [Prunus dulcis]